MREILFKAKRKDNNEWVYGYYHKETSTSIALQEYGINEIEEHYIHTVIDHLSFKIEVLPETICEYTGIKDKNGVEIYENDIISATEHLTNGYIGIGEVDLYYEVNYIDRLSKYALNPRIINGKYNSNNFELDMFHYKAEDIEVIGNIFDKGVE